MLSNWEITFERLSNGAIEKDTFVANNKKEVGECFRACYRHDNYKILNVRLIEELTEEIEKSAELSHK